MRQSDLTIQLTSFFSNEINEPSIEMAYLFGSRVDGKEGPISDYDIALLFSKRHTPILRYEIAYKLSNFLRADQVDTLTLNYAPIELQYAVIATGTILYEVNIEARVEYEALTLSRYGDFLPILRRQRQEILEENSNETGIQRYRAALGKTQRMLEKIRAI